MKLNKFQKNALSIVLDYLYSDEEENYYEYLESGSDVSDHIFKSIEVLANALAASSLKSETETCRTLEEFFTV